MFWDPSKGQWCPKRRKDLVGDRNVPLCLCDMNLCWHPNGLPCLRHPTHQIQLHLGLLHGPDPALQLQGAAHEPRTSKVWWLSLKGSHLALLARAFPLSFQFLTPILSVFLLPSPWQQALLARAFWSTLLARVAWGTLLARLQTEWDQTTPFAKVLPTGPKLQRRTSQAKHTWHAQNKQQLQNKEKPTTFC